MKLYFRKEGSGAPLVIIHGLYGSSDNWLGVAKKLASSFTVYAVDLRNHGHSPHDPEHTYQSMKTDLVRFFEDHIREKAIIIGHSMGGKLAMWFASEYPELVRQLIIVDIAPVNYREVDDEGQYFLHRNILQAMIGLDFSRVKNRKQVEEILAEQIDSPRIRQFLLKNVASDHHTHRLKWRLNVNALWEYIDEIVEGVNFRWLDDRIPIIAYPVTFIRGLESHYVSDESIPLIKKIYPEATIIDIPEAGHWLHAEQPELFMQALRNILRLNSN